MDLETLPAIRGESRREQIVSVLRQAIISGRILPGDRLVESDISTQMHTSRGPVREALCQLEQEGLVVSYPYRGAEVVGISQDEVEEVLVPIRLVLERFAFRHALPRLAQADFDRLEALVQAMRDAVDSGKMEQIVDTDIRIHEFIIAKSDWQHCLQIWRSIVPRVRAYFYRDAPIHPSASELVEEHVELLAAIRSRDTETVLSVLERHIQHYMTPDGSK